MLPVILAAVGGYLVYDSLKSKKFADGGTADEIMDSDGQTDKELYDALKDMGYNFGKYGTSKFDEDGFSEMAVNLGYRWDEKKKVWHNKNMMADGGETTDAAYKKRMKMFGHTPYGKTKGKFKVTYNAEGEPQTEIWESMEMAKDSAKRYSRMDDFSDVKIFDESGKEIQFTDGGMMADGGMTKTKPTSDAEMKETMRQLLTRNKNSHSRAKGRIELYSYGSFKDWNSFFTEYEKRFGKQDADIVKKAKANYDSAVLVKIKK